MINFRQCYEEQEIGVFMGSFEHEVFYDSILSVILGDSCSTYSLVLIFQQMPG